MTRPAGADRCDDTDWRAFGQLVFDISKPDGTLRKLLDISRLRVLGWEPPTKFKAGLANAYRDFLQRYP